MLRIECGNDCTFHCGSASIPAMAEIVLDDVTKEFPGGVRAVDGVSLTIGEGEFMVLVGPSGCGKTTLLRSIGGLEKVTGGRILIGERDVTRLEPADRDLAMVFQNYALYPHMTVEKNLGYGLRVRKTPKQERARRVAAVAEMLGLENLLQRRPGQLSGGQQQRVAMGRAIIREPQAFLMDEPLSNLDAKLRTQMRAEISLLHKELGVTTLYVTHDQVEAMTLGQRVTVMRKGELQQVATPQELYDRPVNLFVAGFIGSPPMNFVQGEVVRDGGVVEVQIGDQRLSVDDGERALASGLDDWVGRRLIVGIRPEHLEDAAIDSAAAPDRRLNGRVRLRELLGSESIVHFQIDAAPAVSPELIELAEEIDETTLLDALDDQRRMRRTALVGRFGVDSRVREDEDAQVAVRPRALRFFDAENGRRIGVEPSSVTA
jgi:multiple sugar transport system ATP-binding protein